jgi:hypothetical protein
MKTNKREKKLIQLEEKVISKWQSLTQPICRISSLEEPSPPKKGSSGYPAKIGRSQAYPADGEEGGFPSLLVQ